MEVGEFENNLLNQQAQKQPAENLSITNLQLDGSCQEVPGAESKDKLKQPLHLSYFRQKDFSTSNLLHAPITEATPVSSSENSRIDKSQRMHGLIHPQCLSTRRERKYN